MLTIDRFEQDWAICFDQQGQEIRLLRSVLPPEAGEGDRLLPDGGGWVLDREGTEAKKQELRQRLARLAAGDGQP